MSSYRSSKIFSTAIFLTTIAASSFAAGNDILISDFESGTYGDWKAEGEAFGTGPVTNALPNQKAVKYFNGKYFVDSYGKGDSDLGRLESPQFNIERDHIRFLIGGGEIPTNVCINLLLDGKVVRTSS